MDVIFDYVAATDISDTVSDTASDTVSFSHIVMKQDSSESNLESQI